jgi:hypothetical protein
LPDAAGLRLADAAAFACRLTLFVRFNDFSPQKAIGHIEKTPNPAFGEPGEAQGDGAHINGAFRIPLNFPSRLKSA